MGTRWESALVECSVDELNLIAQAAADLVPLVLRQRLSLDAHPAAGRDGLWSLECAGFRSGTVVLQTAMSGAVADTMLQLPPEVQDVARLSANFAVAQLASRTIGAARWIFLSDSLGQSCAVVFRNGAVESAAWSDDQADSRYDLAALAAVQELLPNLTHIDEDLFEAFYGKTSAPIRIAVGV